jgi:hypothetical protein
MEIKTIQDINDSILESYNQSRERRLGRYSATDVNKMFKDLTPENFFEPKPVDMKGVKNIFRGYAYESQLAKEFEKIGLKYEKDGEGQLKIEYDVLGDRIIPKEELESKDYKPPEIVLVMKPDFPLEKVVLETKAPNKLKDNIPPWYVEQCEIQYRLLKKKIVMVLINTGDNEFPLLLGIEYKPSDIRWKNIREKIVRFHKKLKEKKL